MDELKVVRTGEEGTAACEACACLRAGHLIATTDRRGFLAQGAAALAMLALAACGGDTSSAPDTLPTTTLTLSANPSLVSVGGVLVTTISGSPVAVVHETDATFSAFSLVCPHQGSTVQFIGSSGFLCPGHGARFNLEGQWVGGQPTSSLRSYPVTYDAASGTVTIGTR